MRFGRRRPQDPQRIAILSGFLPVGEHVEAAQKALLRAVPTFRSDGTPIALALVEFGAHLDEADSALVIWAAPDALVERCKTAISTAREEATKVRLSPGNPEFESLNAQIGDILYPLESIVEIEAELREPPRR